MLVYLSHPYTGNETNNIKHSSEIALKLSKKYTVLNPLTNFTFINDDFTYNEIMKMCIEMLSKCDKLIYCGISKGVEIEIAYAMSRGILVDEWSGDIG